MSAYFSPLFSLTYFRLPSWLPNNKKQSQTTLRYNPVLFFLCFLSAQQKIFLPWSPKYCRNIQIFKWCFCTNAITPQPRQLWYSSVFLEPTFSTIHLYSCWHLYSEIPHLGREALSTNWGVRSGRGSDRGKVIDSYRRPQLVQPPQPPRLYLFFFLPPATIFVIGGRAELMVR